MVDTSELAQAAEDIYSMDRKIAEQTEILKGLKKAREDLIQVLLADCASANQTSFLGQAGGVGP